MELIIRGDLLRFPAFGQLEILEDVVLGVVDGKILAMEKGVPGTDILCQNSRAAFLKAGLSLAEPTYHRLKVPPLHFTPFLASSAQKALQESA